MSGIQIQNSPNPWEPGEVSIFERKIIKKVWLILFLLQSFSFISQKCKIFENLSSLKSTQRLNLITNARKYGITFISDQSSIKGNTNIVNEELVLIDYFCFSVFNQSEFEGDNITPCKIISGRGKIFYLAANCDDSILLVVSFLNNTLLGFFYDIFDIVNSVSKVKSSTFTFIMFI